MRSSLEVSQWNQALMAVDTNYAHYLHLKEFQIPIEP